MSIQESATEQFIIHRTARTQFINAINYLQSNLNFLNLSTWKVINKARENPKRYIEQFLVDDCPLYTGCLPRIILNLDDPQLCFPCQVIMYHMCTKIAEEKGLSPYGNKCNFEAFKKCAMIEACGDHSIQNYQDITDEEEGQT